MTTVAPLNVLACHVYATPSCNTPAGIVHVGLVWQPDSTTTPDLPSLPVATRKQYLTASPSGSVTAFTANVGVNVVCTLLSGGAIWIGAGGAFPRSTVNVTARFLYVHTFAISAPTSMK